MTSSFISFLGVQTDFVPQQKTLSVIVPIISFPNSSIADHGGGREYTARRNGLPPRTFGVMPLLVYPAVVFRYVNTNCDGLSQLYND
jgi:hypothetical protein